MYLYMYVQSIILLNWLSVLNKIRGECAWIHFSQKNGVLRIERDQGYISVGADAGETESIIKTGATSCSCYNGQVQFTRAKSSVLPPKGHPIQFGLEIEE